MAELILAGQLAEAETRLIDGHPESAIANGYLVVRTRYSGLELLVGQSGDGSNPVMGVYDPVTDFEWHVGSDQ